jgi:hypothetical protein
MTKGRRTWIMALLAVLLAVGAQAQRVGGPPYLWSSSRPDPANMKQESASVIALRDGGTAAVLAPQDWTIYQFCDAEPTCTTGYNRARLGWSLSASFFDIAFESAGTGTAKSMRLGTGFGAVQMNAPTVPATDNGQPIGSAAARFTRGYFARSIQGSQSKALTDAGAAVSVTRIPVATNSYIGGWMEWVATATDGTDQKTLVGRTRFAFADKAGTPQCTVAADGTDLLESTNANTLACTVSAAVSTTNCDLQVTCTDNTGGAQTVAFNYRLNLPTMAAEANQ